MSGLDGRPFIDTAFLGPGWELAETVPASTAYADCETAIWDMCPGCIDERGWLEMVDPRGDICPWMREAMECGGKPMVDRWEGPDGQRLCQCHHRRELWVREEEATQCEGQVALFG